MSSFRDQVREDFDKVLLDTDIFGRICSWNGAPLKIAEDARVDSQQYQAQGVNGETKIIYCRDIDFNPAPKVEEQVKFDNEYWRVADIKKPFGYLVITLKRVTA
jgi:hypothetical protein